MLVLDDLQHLLVLAPQIVGGLRLVLFADCFTVLDLGELSLKLQSLPGDRNAPVVFILQRTPLRRVLLASLSLPRLCNVDLDVAALTGHVQVSKRVDLPLTAIRFLLHLLPVPLCLFVRDFLGIRDGLFRGCLLQRRDSRLRGLLGVAQEQLLLHGVDRALACELVDPLPIFVAPEHLARFRRLDVKPACRLNLRLECQFLFPVALALLALLFLLHLGLLHGVQLLGGAINLARKGVLSKLDRTRQPVLDCAGPTVEQVHHRRQPADSVLQPRAEIGSQASPRPLQQQRAVPREVMGPGELHHQVKPDLDRRSDANHRRPCGLFHVELLFRKILSRISGGSLLAVLLHPERLHLAIEPLLLRVLFPHGLGKDRVRHPLLLHPDLRLGPPCRLNVAIQPRQVRAVVKPVTGDDVPCHATPLPRIRRSYAAASRESPAPWRSAPAPAAAPGSGSVAPGCAG